MAKQGHSMSNVIMSSDERVDNENCHECTSDSFHWPRVYQTTIALSYYYLIIVFLTLFSKSIITTSDDNDFI